MNKKIYALVLIMMLLSLVLSACTRSATSKSPTDATPTSEIPFPVGTLDTSARVTEIVQQTQNAAISTPIVPVVPTAKVPSGNHASGRPNDRRVANHRIAAHRHQTTGRFTDPVPPSNLHHPERRMADLHRPPLQSGS